MLGNLKFAGIGWSTILSIAFCGIDFAGIARLFTPEQGADEPAEVWYLFGAWILAAAMNAALTWWGVSVAIVNHTSQGSAVISSETIQTVVPVFVAVMVWVIRILIIGTFSLAGDRMFSQAERRTSRREYAQPSSTTTRTNNYQPAAPVRTNNYQPQRAPVSAAPSTVNRPSLVPASSLRPQPKPAPRPEPTYHRTEPTYSRPEPTYQNIMSSSHANSEHEER